MAANHLMPGTLVITTDHVCKAVGPYNDMSRNYMSLEKPTSHECLERGVVGMIIAIRYKPVTYYRILVGNKIMNIDINAAIKKYPLAP